MAYNLAGECGGVRKMKQDGGNNTRYEMEDRNISVFQTGDIWCVSCTSPDYGTRGGESYEFVSGLEREQAHEVAKNLAETPLDEFEARPSRGGSL